MFHVKHRLGPKRTPGASVTRKEPMDLDYDEL